MKGKRNSPPAASAAAAVMAQAPPTSPTPKGTAKYTNKDGSKFITVPKSAGPETLPSPPSAPSPTQDSSVRSSPQTRIASNGSVPTGNRKKAKRRAKQAAAREKAESAEGTDRQANGLPSPARSVVPGQGDYAPAPAEDDAAEAGDESGFDQNGDHRTEIGNDEPPARTSKSKKTKKKKKKKDAAAASIDVADDGSNSAPAHQEHAGRAGLVASNETIWNTNSHEERQRIKEFWLDLSEEERKSLVKVEKDTVLKKMKEQQKMTCSCHFCGRKRTAIEEELEGLYDSYYEELEQFANDPTGRQNPPLMSSSRHFAPSSVSRSSVPALVGQQPSHGQIVEPVGDDEEDEGGDEFCDDDDDLVAEDEESDCEDEDIPPEELRRDYTSDIFTFGNSLQVHGGILTVADDLLKNDGRKFIEMMEQLAERRMAREEDAKDQYGGRGGYGPDGNGDIHGYDHHVVSEDDNYSPEDEDDEDYDSQDDEYEEDEEVLTEEQRMEEGRRMFQIFAARMFEQRVLTAYREKVAKERQQKLLEEIEDEQTQESQRKAKKAKEAQKRKDKAAQKRQALAEEKARKEAEKAAEEAERQAEEARKAEEQRQRAEEKRKKREAQKKAEEEERSRKDASRQRRMQEQRDRQAEQERKSREAKEREKKLKDEARQREKEAHEKKEREIRERRGKQESARLEKAAGEKGKVPAKAVPVPVVPAMPPIRAAAAPTGPAAMKVSGTSAVPTAPLTTLPVALAKRPSQQRHPNAIPPLPAGFASPQIPAATPVMPKAPTPMRARQPSQHGGSTGGSQSGAGSRTASLSGSGQSQTASPIPVTPVQASLGSFGLAKGNVTMSSIGQSMANQTQHLNQTSSPLSMPVSQAMQPQNSPFSAAPSPIGLHYPLGTAPVTLPPGLPLSSQFGQMGPGSFRAPGPPPMMPMPPGLNGLGRGFGPMVPPPPGFGHPLPPDQQHGTAVPAVPLQMDSDGIPTTHSRHASAGYDTGSSPSPAANPISRPAPIGRPGSVVHGQQAEPGPLAGPSASDGDSDNPFHLGSKALLDDSDFTLGGFPGRRPTSARSGFGTAPIPFGMGVDLASPFASQASLWGSLPSSHGLPGSFSSGPQAGFPMGGVAPGGWGVPMNPPAFPSHGSGVRSSQARSLTLRQMLCRVCQELSGSIDADGELMTLSDGTVNDTFIPIEPVKSRVAMLAQSYLGPIQDSELDVLYDTEGNGNNGGGNFEVHRGKGGLVTAIRWAPDSHAPRRSIGGDMGSPAIGFGEGSPAPASTAPIGATPFR